MIRKITVLYDARCGFCLRCKDWMLARARFVDLEFVWNRSPEVERRWPGLDLGDPPELVVVDDEGGVYRGASAWIVCLWALVDYREWSLRLADPELFPFARRAFELLSSSRGWISRAFGLSVAREIAEAVEDAKNGKLPVREVGGPKRCAYCHDDATGADARSCPRCRSLLHEDCAAELGSACGTLGCAGRG
jgi:predicted DCC family thiol-disulfide oxidoreductase YuxK